MTSYYWDGAAHGDAIEAPYDASTFATLLKALYTPQGNRVVWRSDYDSLRVDGVASRNVDVNTGVGVIQGVVYENTAVVRLSIAENTSGNPRIDSIVVRYTASSNECRLAVRMGLPAILPVAPTISENELLLANVYLTSGFATVNDVVVYDKRKFMLNSDHLRYFYTDNTMVNSEFFLFSNANTGTYPPDYWTKVGTASFGHVDKFDYQQRGRAVSLTMAGAAAGMSTDILTTEGTAKVFTLSLLIKVVSGVGHITFAGEERYVYPGTDIQDVTIRVSTNGYQALQILSVGGGAELQVGQVTITQGYIKAPYVAKHETLLVNHAGATTVTAVSYTGKSTGTTTVTFPANFYLPGIESSLVQLYVNDSGSAGADVYARLISGTVDHKVHVYTGGLTNDAKRSGFGVISGMSCALDCVASGAGTMDATISLVGIIV